MDALRKTPAGKEIHEDLFSAEGKGYIAATDDAERFDGLKLSSDVRTLDDIPEMDLTCPLPPLPFSSKERERFLMGMASCYREILFNTMLSLKSGESGDELVSKLLKEKNSRYEKQRMGKAQRASIFNAAKDAGKSDADAYREIIAAEHPCDSDYKLGGKEYTHAMDKLRKWKSDNKNLFKM